VILVLNQNVVADIYLTAIPDPTMKVAAILGTVMVALTLIFAALLTLLLVGRIIVLRRRHIRLMGK
jgi:hypothetical protein